MNISKGKPSASAQSQHITTLDQEKDIVRTTENSLHDLPELINLTAFPQPSDQNQVNVMQGEAIPTDLLPNLEKCDSDAQQMRGSLTMLIEEFIRGNDAAYDMEATDSSVFTVLQAAILTRRHAVVNQLLDKYLSSSQIQTDAFGQTALMLSAYLGELETARKLMQKEVGLKTQGHSLTALMFAAIARKYEICQLLKAREARMQTQGGWTAMMLAAQDGFAEIVELLAPLEKDLRERNGRTALMIAAANNHVDCVKILAQHEARLQDCNGVSALMIAADLGYREIVRILAPKEYMLHQRNGWSALFFSVQQQNLDGVSILLQYEDPKEKDEWGNTALDLAVQGGWMEGKEVLVDHFV